MFTFGRIKDKVVAVLSRWQRKIRRAARQFYFASIDPDPVRRLFPNEANLQGAGFSQNLLRR